MTQIRSPAYPAIPLEQALELTKKIHDANRTNPIDREAAAREMGFSGLTGTSTKMLADLAHFGLIEKAGKGGIRVSQRAVDIIYPVSALGKTAALVDAASAPALFSSLRQHFSDGVPSENALKSYLMRQGFVSAAIPYVVNSYLETSRFLQGSGGTESHGDDQKTAAESNGSKGALGSVAAVSGISALPLRSPEPPPSREKSIMDGERVIFVDEAAPGRYLKVIASGELDDNLLEGLEDFAKRWKKRLATTKKEPPVAGTEGDTKSD